MTALLAFPFAIYGIALFVGAITGQLGLDDIPRDRVH
jgi:hypothetical protein